MTGNAPFWDLCFDIVIYRIWLNVTFIIHCHLNGVMHLLWSIWNTRLINSSFYNVRQQLACICSSVYPTRYVISSGSCFVGSIDADVEALSMIMPIAEDLSLYDVHENFRCFPCVKRPDRIMTHHLFWLLMFIFMSWNMNAAFTKCTNMYGNMIVAYITVIML